MFSNLKSFILFLVLANLVHGLPEDNDGDVKTLKCRVEPVRNELVDFVLVVDLLVLIIVAVLIIIILILRMYCNRRGLVNQ